MPNSIYMKVKYEKLLLILLIAGELTGCTAKPQRDIPNHIKSLKNLKAYSADAKPAYTFKPERAVIYRDTSNVLLGARIGEVEVDDKRRVYILDSDQLKVHIFNHDGTFLTSVGRQGQGPGEFQYIGDIQVDHRNLYVLDPLQHKISVFGQGTFKHVKDLNISLKESDGPPTWIDSMRKNKQNYLPNNFFVRPDGRFYVIFSDNGVSTAVNIPGRTYEFSLYSIGEEKYIRHDMRSFRWTGGVLIHETKNRAMVFFQVPYKRTSQFDYSNGQLVYGWTEDFLFKFYDESGTYQHAFYYPFPRIKLKLEQVFAYYGKNINHKTKDAFRSDTLPATWPAFHSMKTDDQGRLWVSKFTSNPARYEWLVMNTQGKLLARFTWPRERELKELKNGYAYTLEKDEQTGSQKVVRYLIEMEEN